MDAPKQEVIDNANPPGLEFQANGKTMKYVYPDTPCSAAGWLLYKHPDGQWVTLRKATDADVSAITRAVVRSHHG